MFSHKTQAILINTTKTIPIVPLIQINNHDIKYSPCVKNLGITIDQTLNFIQYTIDLSKSINRTLHTTRLIIPSITTELSKLLATSLILPRLDYCNSILHRIPKKLTNTTQPITEFHCTNCLQNPQILQESHNSIPKISSLASHHTTNPIQNLTDIPPSHSSQSPRLPYWYTNIK